MCKPIGMVFDKDYKFYSHPQSDSHTRVMELHSLRDEWTGKNRDYLKCEVLPKGSLSSSDPTDWVFTMDSERPYPEWFCFQTAKAIGMATAMELIAAGRYSGKWGGSLDLQGTDVTDLGSLIRVDGDLDLEGSKVTDLGSLIRVDGDLDLEGSKVTSLGNLTHVGEYLYLQGTQVKELPPGLLVEGEIIGLEE